MSTNSTEVLVIDNSEVKGNSTKDCQDYSTNVIIEALNKLDNADQITLEIDSNDEVKNPKKRRYCQKRDKDDSSILKAIERKSLSEK